MSTKIDPKQHSRDCKRGWETRMLNALHRAIAIAEGADLGVPDKQASDLRLWCQRQLMPKWEPGTRDPDRPGPQLVRLWFIWRDPQGRQLQASLDRTTPVGEAVIKAAVAEWRKQRG